MRSFRKILVAVKDPFARSIPSVAKAAQLATASGAKLEIFHALTRPVYVDAATQPDILAPVQHERERAARRLQGLAAGLRRDGLEVTITVDADFPAYEAIIRQAQRVGADLIVADCHARHRSAWLLQLTDWELLRRSPVPVLLVKSARPYRKPVVLAAIDPLHTFAKPSHLDDRILESADAIRGTMRGSMHVMHAFYPTPVDATPAQILNPEISTRLQAKARAVSKRAVRSAVEGLRVPASRQHSVEQHPFDAIEQLSRAVRADILVMGAISRSGLKRLLIGNTAERVLDSVACDVLVVKPRTFENKVPRAKRGMRFATAPVIYPH